MKEIPDKVAHSLKSKSGHFQKEETSTVHTDYRNYIATVSIQPGHLVT